MNIEQIRDEIKQLKFDDLKTQIVKLFNLLNKQSEDRMKIAVNFDPNKALKENHDAKAAANTDVNLQECLKKLNSALGVLSDNGSQRLYSINHYIYCKGNDTFGKSVDAKDAWSNSVPNTLFKTANSDYIQLMGFIYGAEALSALATYHKVPIQNDINSFMAKLLELKNQLEPQIISTLNFTGEPHTFK
jgi:hypothetical protein